MARSTQLAAHPLVLGSDSEAADEAGGVPRASIGGGRPALDRRLLASAALGLGAAVALVIGWLQVSATNDIYAQMPYFFSIGGVALGLMLAAIAVFVDYEHSCDRRGIALLLERLDDLETRIEGSAHPVEPAGPTPR